MKVARLSAVSIGRLKSQEIPATAYFCKWQNLTRGCGTAGRTKSKKNFSDTIVSASCLIRYPQQYNCLCYLSYHIYPQNITVSALCPITYNNTIFMFLLPVLSDIYPKFYCFCCLSYHIYPHNITVSDPCPITYTSTILLFLLPVLSDILPQYYCFSYPVFSDKPPQCYCFFFLSYQIYPNNITVSFACPIRYTPTILLFLLFFLSDIPPQYYCFCSM